VDGLPCRLHVRDRRGSVAARTAVGRGVPTKRFRMKDGIASASLFRHCGSPVNTYLTIHHLAPGLETLPAPTPRMTFKTARRRTPPV